MAIKSVIADPVRQIPGDGVESPEQGTAVGLSGGGFRAMLFHLGVLWRMNDAGILSRVNRVSSVSGGSITAGLLGIKWSTLKADNFQNKAFVAHLVEPIRELARHTIDAVAIGVGMVLPGSISDRVEGEYDRRLFHGAKLNELPADHEGPRFVINSTNIQTGTLWRFSRPYMADYQVGKVLDPDVTIAKAVAASSAFPPVLSPCTLNVDPNSFEPASRGKLYGGEFSRNLVLSDGGVYDNLGLETIYKRYTTLLVSDGGQQMASEEKPEHDWARHAIRVLSVVDNQVRALRKKQLIEAFQRKDRDGAYWSIASHFQDFGIDDPFGILTVPQQRLDELAQTKTRLKSLPDRLQENLINWGYAISDAGLRKHAAPALSSRFGLQIIPSNSLPYPKSGF